MEQIDPQNLLTNLATLLPKIECAITEERNAMSDPASILKPTEREFSLDDIDQQHGRSSTLYAFLGLEQLIEFLVFELTTLIHLPNPTFFRIYFRSGEDDLTDSDKNVLVEHYRATIKRSFILNLSTIIESNIRRIADYRISDRPKSKQQDFSDFCKKYCIAKENEEIIQQAFFASSFVEFNKYLSLFPALTKHRTTIDYIQTVRNSTHNGGFYTQKDRKIIYRKSTVIFNHGRPSELPFAHLYPLLEDTFDIFLTLRDEVNTNLRT